MVTEGHAMAMEGSRPIEVVGVVGAGVMGTGVAQVLAEAGYQVVLVDTSTKALDRARASIAQALRFRGLFDKQAARPDTAAILQRIRGTTDVAAIAPAGFVIENVTETWPVKRTVYQQLETTCGADCIFAANTSAIPITRIASATARPDRVLGMHFMNPVPMIAAVEVIRGYHTSPQTLETALALLHSIGKEGIVVNDAPGFVSNRVLMLTVNEAIWVVQDQVANAEAVDRIFKSCLGHKMGPLETGDLIGLDTILYSLEVLQESFGDDKVRPCPLLRKMVDAGLHGRKSGQGFYDYRPSSEKRQRHE
jgi:3-hydroxybutyryl-CoA dehydrogenase